MKKSFIMLVSLNLILTLIGILFILKMANAFCSATGVHGSAVRYIMESKGMCIDFDLFR